jgi:hypothetical protein
LISHAPLIHIGYVKTGSTWLQKFITDNADAGFCEILSRHVSTHKLIKPYILDYDDLPVRREAETRLKRCRQRGLVPVVTHERLSGNPISGGYDGPIIADRLAKLFPEGRVLIVIREQRSMMISVYNEYINGGGACTIQRYLDPPDGAKLPLFNYRFLEYHRLIQYYRMKFGGDKVLVLPFELFSTEPLTFCIKIAEFAGVPPINQVNSRKLRASKKHAVVALERLINFFCVPDNSNPAAPFNAPGLRRVASLIGEWVPMSIDKKIGARKKAYVMAFAKDLYRESNRLTQEIMDDSLVDYGYML